MLLVEHDVPLVLSVCDRVTVMQFGSVIAEGTPAAIGTDPAVLAAYLGTEEELTIDARLSSTISASEPW